MTLADGVNWQAVLAVVQAGKAQAAAGYIDGKDSAWPAEAWARFTVPVLRISVLANPAAMAFDVEPGNAGPAKVSVAIATRTSHGLPSVAYGDAHTILALSVTWRPPATWPKPGAYLWAAPGTPGVIPAWCPVDPVAVQDRYLGTYDLSTLYTGWLPVLGPGPLPPSTPGKDTPMVILRGPDGSAYVVSGGKAVGLTTGAEITSAEAAGIPVWQFSVQAQYEAVVAGFA